jgi:hypothetical protein
MQFEKELSNSKINYYYCASFLIIVTAVLIKLPALVTSAEFYAETMTIFFKEAREATPWEILTYTWADYLVTFQLLVSFVLVRVFGVVDYFPGTVNFLFLLFVAFSSSLINLRAFRVLIESDFLRFVIGLSIGLVPNFELYELLHSNLFGFTIFLLFIFVDKDQFRRWFFYMLVVLLFLVGIARPNLAAFLPVYLMLLGIAIKTHRFRDIVFYGAGTVSLALQSYVMIMSQLYWSVRRDTGIYNEISGLESLFVPLESTINHYFRTMLGVIFNQQLNGFGLIVGLIIIVTVIILAACYFLYRCKRYLPLYYFGLSQILAFGLLYFITFSSPVTTDWEMMRYDPMRWWIYSNFVIYLSLMVLAYNTVREILSRITVVMMQYMPPPIVSSETMYDMLSRGAVLALSLLPVLFHIHPFYRYVEPYAGNNSLSNWASYRHLLKEDDYYIPTNPVQHYQWGIWKDNERLRIDVKVEAAVTGVQLSETEGEVMVRSILLVNYDYESAMKDLIIKAYDREGREIAIPRRLNDFDQRYLYYYFSERVRPYSLSFFNEKLQSVYIRPELHLFGKLETTERIVITEKQEILSGSQGQ